MGGGEGWVSRGCVEKPDVKQSHTTSPVPPAKSAQEAASNSLLVNLNYWPLELLFDNVVQVIYGSATPSSRQMSTAVNRHLVSSTLPAVNWQIVSSTPLLTGKRSVSPLLGMCTICVATCQQLLERDSAPLAMFGSYDWMHLQRDST